MSVINCLVMKCLHPFTRCDRSWYRSICSQWDHY